MTVLTVFSALLIIGSSAATDSFDFAGKTNLFHLCGTTFAPGNDFPSSGVNKREVNDCTRRDQRRRIQKNDQDQNPRQVYATQNGESIQGLRLQVGQPVFPY